MFKNKLLIIGSIPHSGIEKTYGGTTILMQSFLNYCKENDIPNHFIQANKFIGNLSPAWNFIYVLIRFFTKIWDVNIVMVNVASRGAFFLAPIIYLLSRLFGKKFIFRKFGGNFHHIYQSRSKWKRRLLKETVFKSDIMFFETLEMVDFFQKNLKVDDRIFWLPNVRKEPSIKKESEDYRRRFVFISHVKKTKGVVEIVEASEGLTENYTVDLFGPIMEDSFSLDYFKGTNVNYKGVLSPEDVIATLSGYDFLLLPTFHLGEGYPGIVIESLSLGIPVISTYWNAIPEIIQDNENGLLIPINDSNALLKAMSSIEKKNYILFSVNAKKSFEKFHDEKVYNNLIEKIKTL